MKTLPQFQHFKVSARFSLCFSFSSASPVLFFLYCFPEFNFNLLLRELFKKLIRKKCVLKTNPPSSSSNWQTSSFVYDVIIIMLTIISIRVRCDQHPCTMRSASVYDAIIIICVRCDHHHSDNLPHSCTMWSSFMYDAIISSWWRSSSFVFIAIIIICVRCDHHHPTPRIALFVRYRKRSHCM